MLNLIHNSGKLLVAYAFAYTLGAVSVGAGVVAALGVTLVAAAEILLAKQVDKVRADYQKQIQEAIGEVNAGYLNN